MGLNAHYLEGWRLSKVGRGTEEGTLHVRYTDLLCFRPTLSFCLQETKIQGENMANGIGRVFSIAQDTEVIYSHM